MYYRNRYWRNLNDEFSEMGLALIGFALLAVTVYAVINMLVKIGLAVYNYFNEKHDTDKPEAKTVKLLPTNSEDVKRF